MLKVHGFGNVGRVDEPKMLSNDRMVINFTIASNEWRNNEEVTCWYNCSWFLSTKSKKQARLIPGATVVIESGRWEVRMDTKDGNTNYYNNLILDRGSDLQFPPAGKRPEQGQTQQHDQQSNVAPQMPSAVAAAPSQTQYTQPLQPVVTDPNQPTPPPQVEIPTPPPPAQTFPDPMQQAGNVGGYVPPTPQG